MKPYFYKGKFSPKLFARVTDTVYKSEPILNTKECIIRSTSEILPVKVNWNLEIFLTVVGLSFTVLMTILLWQDIGSIFQEKIITGSIVSSIEQGVFIVIVLFLIYGNVVYQFSRLGFLIRDKKHARTRKEDTLYLFADHAPSVTILIPSYKEKVRIIHQTVLSSALQHYFNKKIVLLIDDPPSSDNIEDIKGLTDARNLLKEVAEFLRLPREHYKTAKAEFLARSIQNEVDFKSESQKLAAFYTSAALYLQDYAKSYKITDHTDRLFTKRILLQPAQEYQNFARILKDGSKTLESKNELLSYYNRLIAGFSAELSSFERKRYENLSHEKNKAMNINTYIGLMGNSFLEVKCNGKLFLEPCNSSEASLKVEDSKYIITLDADSLIVSDYALRLIHVMEKEGNERLAVIQTPYSAVPEADKILERIAGATTDIQLLIHQGFTWANATYWVGANALLRKKALEDIKAIEEERSYKITRYIQDRTVIEDTESSIDLVDKGWSLYNYPARLAYSATPPDYGSLLVQRRRWANGGLIILPKLLHHVVKNLSLKKLLECFIRTHYLISITVSSLGTLILIMHPFDDVMRTAWLPLSALPYFYLYGRDLKSLGYKWKDLIRVYTLNLMLIPINLGGVLKSIEQGITKKKIPFVRTPKVENRTAASPLYIISTALILVYCFGVFTLDAIEVRWLHAAFSLMNGVFLTYAFAHFIGWREGLEDIKVVWQDHQAQKIFKIIRSAWVNSLGSIKVWLLRFARNS